MLAGIVVNNAIVFIDYINFLRGNGYQMEQAIIEAGRTRLRPVLMSDFNYRTRYGSFSFRSW